MGLKNWRDIGVAALAAALIAAPIAMSSSAIGAPTEETNAPPTAPFNDPALNDIVEKGCYEYPEFVTSDAAVERTDKTWGHIDTTKEEKASRWLTVSQTRTEKVTESREAEDGAAQPSPAVNPCVVVRAADSTNFSRPLLFSTFSTVNDSWAAVKKFGGQSVDVFMDTREIVADSGSKVWLSGQVRSQVPAEFKNNVMVDAQELAEQAGKTLKAPMFIDETNSTVTLHFSSAGYYAVEWSAEMNLGSNTLYSNKHLQVFRVIEADAPAIEPSEEPEPTEPEETQPSDEPTEPSKKPGETGDPGAPNETDDPDETGQPVEPDPGTDPGTVPTPDPTDTKEPPPVEPGETPGEDPDESNGTETPSPTDPSEEPGKPGDPDNPGETPSIEPGETPGETPGEDPDESNGTETPSPTEPGEEPTVPSEEPSQPAETEEPTPVEPDPTDEPGQPGDSEDPDSQDPTPTDPSEEPGEPEDPTPGPEPSAPQPGNDPESSIPSADPGRPNSSILPLPGSDSTLPSSGPSQPDSEGGISSPSTPGENDIPSTVSPDPSGTTPGSSSSTDSSDNGLQPGEADVTFMPGNTSSPTDSQNSQPSKTGDAHTDVNDRNSAAPLRPGSSLVDDGGNPVVRGNNGRLQGAFGNSAPSDSSDISTSTQPESASSAVRSQAPNLLDSSDITDASNYPPINNNKQPTVVSPQEASKQWAKSASSSVLFGGAGAVLLAAGVSGISLLRKP